ncbi:MAG: surface protein [Flavipsychrobacter sp.]|nr:surface protein [Flavipsychrobacter sp.]
MLHAQFINTMAGNGSYGGGAENVQATSTSMTNPVGVYVDKWRNVYFIDQSVYQVKKVTPDGVIRTIAGDGSWAYTGDGGPATDASLAYPFDLYVDTSGNVLIADTYNSVIRKVTPAGIISTICGTGFSGSSGDGGPAIAAQLSNPTGICGDNKGNIYISDNGNYTIRKIDAAGIITTIAGTPGVPGFTGDGGPAAAALLDDPNGIAADTFGRVYFADATDQRIRMINALGVINSIAGSGTTGGFSGDGGPATTAELSYPSDVHTDPSGENIYIADNNNSIIRLVTASTGIISTFAGTPLFYSFGGDGGLATLAQCYTPSSVFTTDDNVVYLTDDNNYRVRRIAPCVVPGTASPITCAATVCVSATVTATDATANGTWSASNAHVSIDANTGVVTGASVGPVTITYTALGKCGNEIATTSITVDDVPATVPITGASSVCVSASVSLTNSISGGTWSSSNTLVSVSGLGVVTAGPTGGTATVSYTLSNSCGSSSSTKIITVNTAPVLAAITGPASVCETVTITLSDATPVGVWSSANSTIATINTLGVVSGIAPGTATISYTKTNLCGTSAVTSVITVDPLPTTGTITGTTSVCELFSTNLFDAVPGGVWSSANSTIATVSLTGTVSGLIPGTALISYATTNGCGTRAATTVVTVVTTPITSGITGASAVCMGSTTLYTDGVTGGVWSSNDASIASINSSGTVTGVTPGATVITYSVINSCGTVNATKNITVDVMAVIAPITGLSATCESSSLLLNDITPGGVWASSDPSIAVISSSGLVTSVSPGNFTASYSITNSCGTSTMTKPVTIIPLPAPSFTVVGTLLSTTKKYLTYQWYKGADPIPGATNFSYRISEPGYYSVTVTDPGGCVGYSTDVRILFTSGVAAISSTDNSLEVYPSPNNGLFTINLLSGSAAPAQVTITNILGQKVKELAIPANQPTQVKMEQPAGIYFISALQGDTKLLSKVVIN